MDDLKFDRECTPENTTWKGRRLERHTKEELMEIVAFQENRFRKMLRDNQHEREVSRAVREQSRKANQTGFLARMFFGGER